MNNNNNPTQHKCSVTGISFCGDCDKEYLHSLEGQSFPVEINKWDEPKDKWELIRLNEWDKGCLYN